MKVFFTITFLIIALVCCGIWQFHYRASGVLPEIRAQASPHLKVLNLEDYAADLETLEADQRMLSLRAEADSNVLSPEFISAVQFIRDTPALLAKASVEGGEEEAESGRVDQALLAPLLAQDGASPPRLFAALPKDWQDALDLDGHPVRWRLPDNLLAGYSILRPQRQPVELSAKAEIANAPRLPRLSPSERAAHYRELVKNFARRYNLSSDLVMAIIHSESDFKPTLVSNKSAMGLMQLLPSTASDEVHRFLYGRRGQISFEQLRVPEINIRYGTAYLHILLNRYFPNVKNRSVQEACAIAAYNMGPNRFLRLYGKNDESAVAKINSMGEEEFFADLLRRLPVRETRYYVEKVRRMKQHYSSLP